MDRGRHVVDVPRVDEDGAGAEGLRGPRKLAEHEHAVVLGLARHELVADEVHAVAEGGDERDVGDRVQRAQLLERELAVEVVDRDVRQRAEAACRSAGGGVNLTAKRSA